MPTLLAEAAANLDAWTMTPIAQMPTMQLAYARYLGATPVLQLHDKESLGCITTPCDRTCSAAPEARLGSP